MTIQIGRNDPCPCGSGKKYKKCCIITSSTPLPVADFEWRKLRQVEGEVIDKHLLPYATKTLPAEAVAIALSDCFSEDLPDSLDRELLFNYFFLPWFLFNWVPYENFGLTHFQPEQTLAENYLNTHANRLNSLEWRFINAMSHTYYSFYCILNVEPEKSLQVKDILLDSVHTIKERQGTRYLKRGDIVFSRLLTLDQQSIFIGMAPYSVPADYHILLIHFQEWLINENNNKALTGDLLRDVYASLLLEHFFAILKTAYDKPLQLANTDGDPLAFCKAYFKLTLTPEETLQRLLPLALSKDPEDFLQTAAYDKTGKVKRIELPWLKKGNKLHKQWKSTVMGQLTLEKGRLILETNSKPRAERGKQLLNKALGEAISFQKMLIESPEQKLKSLPQAKIPENTSALAPPEAQSQLKAMVESHWETWLEEPIPALDNQSPREAAKTRQGQKKLEALLLQYERYDIDNPDNLFKIDSPALRAKLGLDTSFIK